MTSTDVPVPNELESTATESIDQVPPAEETMSKGIAPDRRGIAIKLAD
jgi:hypothetical protein